MLTQEQIVESIQKGRKSETIDDRDFARLSNFFPADQWPIFGFQLKEGEGQPPPPIPWTEDEILKQLRSDVEFGFEKALNKRGISSSLMYSVVKMWMWVLEDPLQDFDNYPMYGLPLFKAVAVKYRFDNPIGDDKGSESHYSEEVYREFDEH